MHDTHDPSSESLRAMRERLRHRLAEESASLDRSWRFAVTKRVATVPRPAIAIAALLVAAIAVYALRSVYRGPSSTLAVIAPEADALPIRALTPGAVVPVTAGELCAGRGPSKMEIGPEVRRAVLRDYGMEGLRDEEYELDYLITPELGGSSDRRNLWPERYGSRVWNARVKDELERLLPELVCRGRVDLRTAQRDIAADWIAAYKKYFGTDRPVITEARAYTPD